MDVAGTPGVLVSPCDAALLLPQHGSAGAGPVGQLGGTPMAAPRAVLAAMPTLQTPAASSVFSPFVLLNPTVPSPAVSAAAAAAEPGAAVAAAAAEPGTAAAAAGTEAADRGAAGKAAAAEPASALAAKVESGDAEAQAQARPGGAVAGAGAGDSASERASDALDSRKRWAGEPGASCPHVEGAASSGAAHGCKKRRPPPLAIVAGE